MIKRRTKNCAKIYFKGVKANKELIIANNGSDSQRQVAKKDAEIVSRANMVFYPQHP